jgi:large subunit ribosomal protein L19
MHQKLVEFNKTLRASRADLPVLQAGDVVKVRRKIKEGEKTRIQMFQGMVIAIKGGQSSSQTVTVRKVSSGIGVILFFYNFFHSFGFCGLFCNLFCFFFRNNLFD